MENIKGQIYIHTNKITGKHYVGQTIASPIEARWKKGGDSYNKTTKFGRAIKKYGWENFEHVILHEIYESHEELDKAEIAKIVELDSYKNGYNSTLGGNGSSGYVKSDESKKKISEALKGKSTWIKGTKGARVLSEETKNKISKSLSGRSLSKIHKEKIGKSRVGKTISEEHKEKIRNSRLGNPGNNINKKGTWHLSEETKRRISEALKGKPAKNKGKKISEETKLKISNSIKTKRQH